MKRNKFLLAALTAALTTAAFTAVHAQETKIELTINNAYMKVNGVSAEIDPGNGTAPVIKDGRTLLPIRAVVEAMGGEVDWKADTKTTVLKKGDDTVELTIGSDTAYLNEESSKLDTAPVIINGRTMLPLRFVAESFGFNTDWDADTKSITITAGETSDEIEYNNNTGDYIERRATDGKIYALGYDGVYVLDKDGKATNKYLTTGDNGFVYTDESGKFYMLTFNLETDEYELDGKDGSTIKFSDVQETMMSLTAIGDDGLTYDGIAMSYMYSLDKDGKIVKKFTATGEQDGVYADKDGNKLLYVIAKDGGADDYVSCGGNTVMLERAYYTTYLGSDGLTYTWANDVLVALDDNFDVVKEYPLKSQYNLLSDNEADDIYTIEVFGLRSAKLLDPDDKETILTYYQTDEDSGWVDYTDSKGNIYSETLENLVVTDKNGKVVKKLEFMAYCSDYTDDKGEIYTIVYGDQPTLLMPGGQTVTLMETYG